MPDNHKMDFHDAPAEKVQDWYGFVRGLRVSVIVIGAVLIFLVLVALP